MPARAEGAHRVGRLGRPRAARVGEGTTLGKARRRKAVESAPAAQALRSEGKTQREIAAALGCSQQSVSNYLRTFTIEPTQLMPLRAENLVYRSQHS